jgi:peptidoglycan/LPS O-acetylase OafA/YrhL
MQRFATTRVIPLLVSDNCQATLSNMSPTVELLATDAVIASEEKPRVAPEARKNPRVPELDGLRGIAILLVMVYHYFYFSPPATHRPQELIPKLYVYFERCIAIGWSGVDLFFVLSGFLIGGILLDARDSPKFFRTFYARRFFRIIPIYYIWIGIFVAVGLGLKWFGTRSPDFQVSWQLVSVHLLFLQNIGFMKYALLSDAFFLPTWSLAVEEQFYLVSPLLVKLLSRKTLLVVLGSIIIGAPILRFCIRNVTFAFANELGWTYTLMPSRADALCLGILAALIWKDAATRARLMAHKNAILFAVSVFAIGVMALGLMSSPFHSLLMESAGATWIAIFYTLVVVLVLVHPGGIVASLARVKILREIGGVSYCIYLIHQAVDLSAQSMLRWSVPQARPWQGIVVSGFAGIASYGIARLSWRYFERRLVERGHAFTY